MRMGWMAGTAGGVDEVVAEVSSMAAAGLQTAWFPQIASWDALTIISVVGREVPGIEFGTAVIPTYPRHPIMLGQQALTTQAAIGGRLALGIGLSHQIVIEGQFGYSFEKPARHMKEYLDILVPLINNGNVSAKGETLSGTTALGIPGSSPCPVLLAALAPRMLHLAGSVGDGTITWMTGPSTIEGHIAPSIQKAAADAGKPTPRIVCGLPIAITDDVDGARQRAQDAFKFYGFLPSYRAMLDKEGLAEPGDIALVGSEQEVGAVLDRLADAGTTDFLAALVTTTEERPRTIDFLASRA